MACEEQQTLLVGHLLTHCLEEALELLYDTLQDQFTKLGDYGEMGRWQDPFFIPPRLEPWDPDYMLQSDPAQIYMEKAIENLDAQLVVVDRLRSLGRNEDEAARRIIRHRESLVKQSKDRAWFRELFSNKATR